jgi:hypothetical protein
MPLPKDEARRAGTRERAPGVCLAADVPDHAPDILSRQAAWLASRLGIGLDRARLLAGLAFRPRGGAHEGDRDAGESHRPAAEEQA